MKMSRAKRKAFNLGKLAGYSEGYAKGLYDGNPFNRILDTAKSLIEKMTNPEIIEAIKEAKAAKEEAEEGEADVEQ